MPMFLRGIVLPFQKGEAPDHPVVSYTPTTPVRIPLMHASSDMTDIPVLPFQADAKLSAGSVLQEETTEDIPVLSSVSGQLSGSIVLNHPQYGELLCAEVHPLGNQRVQLPAQDEKEVTSQSILRAAKDAAIYDELDGVPLYEKLLAWQLPADDQASLHSILVADGTENDIYGSAAWATLAEAPQQVMEGLRLAAQAIHFTRYHIAAMLPKQRRRALKQAIGRINVYTVGDEYPVTRYADGHTEVFRIGVQACLALARAVQQGEKSTSAIVTVAGDGVPRSQNLRIPYGTDLGELLTFCNAEENISVVLGDSMTGTVCTDIHVPLLPGTTTLLVLRQRTPRIPSPCIGCGRCAAVCHAELLPYEIVRRMENMHYERLQNLSPQSCDGCSACSYVCPAGRNVAADVLRAGETGDTILLTWGGDDDE